MLRFLVPVLVAVAVIGAIVAPGGGEEEAAPRAAPEPPSREPPARPDAPSVAIVWGADDLRAAARRLRRARGVETASLIGRGTALMRSSRRASGRVVQRVASGHAVPLDVVAVDPRAYARALAGPARTVVERLGRGEALLSETSARLRRLGRGGVLTLTGGRRLRVAGVLPDGLAQSAEAVVHARDPRVETEPRNVLVRLDPERAPGTGTIARAAGDGARARYALERTAGEGAGRPGLGGGPARPAELKARFGEPSVGLPYGDDWVRLDRRFTRRYIVTRRVPLLGPVTCHREMIRPLRAAMSELERRRLGRLVDPADYAGCQAPRRIRPGGPLSLHAWGLAVDLNASANPFGSRSRQDRRLVRVMKRHGFTWGGDWPSVRDPMHFEWRGR